MAYRWYGDVLAPTGRREEAIAAARRAEELDPVFNSAIVGLELYRARRYDEAVDQMRKSMEMGVSHFPTHRWLSMAYLAKSIKKVSRRVRQEEETSITAAKNSRSF
jgi:hypothetical protein